MKKVIYLLLVCMVVCVSYSPISPSKVKAYVFLAEECPISIYMATTLKENADKFGDQIEWFAVFPNSRSNYKTMALFIEEHGLEDYQRILDEDQSISKRLGAAVTPEVILVNEADEIIYKGQISNAFHKIGRRRNGRIRNVMDEALEAGLNSSSLPKPWPRAVGCFITYKKSY